MLSLSQQLRRLRCALLAVCVVLLIPMAAAATLSPDIDRLLGISRDKPELVGAYISTGYWDLGEVERTMNELGSLGVTFVIDYGLTPPEDQLWESELARYLEIAHDNGIGVAFPLYGALAGMKPGELDDYIDSVLVMVKQMKHHRAISAWYVHDEVLPWVNGDGGTQHYSMSLDDMQELYQAIHAADTRRPQLNVWHALPDRHHYEMIYGEEHLPYGEPEWLADEEQYEQAMRSLVQTTCDWVLVDMYPIDAPWLEDDAVPMDEVARLMKRAAELKRRNQPLYFVFQAFSWAQYRPEDAADALFPTAAQLHEMLAAAHLHGATGAIAYSWFDVAECSGERCKREAPGRMQALSNLADILLTLSTSGWPKPSNAQ